MVDTTLELLKSLAATAPPDNDHALALGLLKMMAAVAPLIAILLAGKVILATEKNMGKFFNMARDKLNNASNRGTSLATNAAKNTRYGQAASQFLSNRKQISALKGRETLRNTLNRNPQLAALMGGPGGGKYASRYLDAENRKHKAEEIQNLQQGLTSNISNAAAKGENVADAINRGTWVGGRAVTAEDRAAFNKLQQQGYVNADGTVKANNPILATAAMQSIMAVEVADTKNMEGLARQLAGSSAEDIAQYSEEMRKAAAAHGYKNFSLGSVGMDGTLYQYYNKTGKTDKAVDRAEGAEKVIQSSIRGIQKDSLDRSMDDSILTAIGRLERRAAASGAVDGRSFVVKIADETSHIDKEAILTDIARELGITLADLKILQRNIKSGGAAAVDNYVKTGRL